MIASEHVSPRRAVVAEPGAVLGDVRRCSAFVENVEKIPLKRDRRVKFETDAI